MIRERLTGRGLLDDVQKVEEACSSSLEHARPNRRAALALSPP